MDVQVETMVRIGVIAAGALAVWYGFDGLYLFSRQIRWPSVVGKIVAAKVVTSNRTVYDRNRRGGWAAREIQEFKHQIAVAFAYEVDGQSYTAQQAWVERYRSDSPMFESGQAVVGRHREGMDALIHYNPANPQESWLHLSAARLATHAILLIGGIAAALVSSSPTLWAQTVAWFASLGRSGS